MCSSGTSPARASSCGPPTCRRRGRPAARSCGASSDVTGVRQGHARAAERARQRPADAGRRAARHQTRPDLLPLGALGAVPGRAAARQLPAQLPATSRSPPRCSATSGRSRPRSTRRCRRKGLPAERRRSARPGVESTYDTYLRGKDGKAQLTVDSRGRPKGAGRVRDQSDARRGAAPDASTSACSARPSARSAYGINLAHSTLRGPARERRRDRRARARKDGAVLAMASYPTYQPSIFVGRKDPQKLAPLLNAKVADADNHPGLQPRDQRRLSAGLDVQARDGARGDAGAPDARRTTSIPCTPTFKDHGSTFHNWTPLINTGMDADDGARRVVRHLLLRARQALLQPARRTAATRCRPGRTASASARPPASTSAPRRPA